MIEINQQNGLPSDVQWQYLIGQVGKALDDNYAVRPYSTTTDFKRRVCDDFATIYLGNKAGHFMMAVDAYLGGESFEEYNPDIWSLLGVDPDLLAGWKTPVYAQSGTPDNKRNVKQAHDHFSSAKGSLYNTAYQVATAYGKSFFQYYAYRVLLAKAQELEAGLTKPLLDYAHTGFGAYKSNDGGYVGLGGVEYKHKGAEEVRTLYYRAYSCLDSLGDVVWGADLESLLKEAEDSWSVYQSIRTLEYQMWEQKRSKPKRSRPKRSKPKLPDEIVYTGDVYQLYRDLQGIPAFCIPDIDYVYNAPMLRDWLGEMLRTANGNISRGDNVRCEFIAEEGVVLVEAVSTQTLEGYGGVKALATFQPLERPIESVPLVV